MGFCIAVLIEPKEENCQGTGVARGKKPFLGRIGIAEIVYQTFKKFLSVVATDSAVCNRGMPHISCNVPGYSMT
ncbi:MAG: hypothetical protein N2V75_06265 [Methanophagales archaeon]|nr:hypothetical protein [Methanophagales archaeon]